MKCITKLFNCKSLILMILSFVFLIQLTACSNSPDEEENETSDYIFVPELTDLLEQHEGLHFAGSAVVIGETLYFSVIKQENVEEKFGTDMIFAANLDGSNILELQNYSTNPPPTDADAGYSRILAMAADPQDNLWIVESIEFYNEDLPDNFEPDPNNPFDILEYRDSIVSDYFHSIRSIVTETSSDYFSSQITAEDAARIIQSRASILASEQFG